VNWNTCQLLCQCLDSIFENISTDFEIIVVDNASNDSSVSVLKKNYPKVRIIENQKNMGFAFANNQAIAISKGEYIVLLNSDAQILSSEPLKIIKNYFRANPKIGIVGGILINQKGKIQSIGKDFMTVKYLIRIYLLFSKNLFRNKKIIKQKKPIFVDYVDGAFLCIRKNVINQIGGLDERFFMYAEDMEWCWRAKTAGWQTITLPFIKIKHLQGQSAQKQLSDNLVNSCRNISFFIKMHQGLKEAKIAYYIIQGGFFLRIFVNIFRNTGWAFAYWKAFRTCLKTRTGFLKTGEKI